MPGPEGPQGERREKKARTMAAGSPRSAVWPKGGPQAALGLQAGLLGLFYELLLLGRLHELRRSRVRHPRRHPPLPLWIAARRAAWLEGDQCPLWWRRYSSRNRKENKTLQELSAGIPGWLSDSWFSASPSRSSATGCRTTSLCTSAGFFLHATERAYTERIERAQTCTYCGGIIPTERVSDSA